MFHEILFIGYLVMACVCVLGVVGWGWGGIKREEEKHTILQTPFSIFATLLYFSLSPELI